MARAIFILTSLLALGSLAIGTAATPPYSIQQREGVCWLAKPDGQRFFSLGVCVVSQGQSRDRFDPANPGYAAFRFYKNSSSWAETTLKRLKSWGFVSIGGWSDYAALEQRNETGIDFIPMLAVGMTAGAPWRDMWDTNIIARMHQIARDQILPLRNDPRLLGYYSDNEMGWWNSTLFNMTLEQPSTSNQRRRLIQMLRKMYHDNWQELLKDFESKRAGSFEDLDSAGVLYLRPGSQGIRAYRRFLGLMAERYYSLVREIIRTYDLRGLILGDRYQSFYYPEVARASGSFIDVSSSNLNAAWNDGTFPRFYLDTLHSLTHKPVIVSEFYMAANQNGSGNKNASRDFPTVMTQQERATGFRNTVEALVRLPYVVGADWFQYFDEPARGRFDGEDYNFGLVDIHDQPYELITSAARKLDLAAIKNRPHSPRQDATLGVPPAPTNPLGQFTPGLALKDWDRERGFVKPVSELPLADLYVCWNREAIYLGLYAQDIAEVNYYHDKIIPEVDRAEWMVTTGESNKPIHIRLSPGTLPVCNESTARIVTLSGAYMNTRTIAAVALPAEVFGQAQFKRGDCIEIGSTFFTHCRADHTEWKGKLTLRN